MTSLLVAARARARAEAQVLAAVADVVAVCREQRLVQPGPSGTERSKIDGDTRRRATTEVVTALGVKPWEARLMVGLTMAGHEITELVAAALERGETCWPQLRKFWELAGSKARKLTADQQELVAEALFGTDPALAAVERFDADGQLALEVPWSQDAFEGAVEREVKACEGVDVVAERERRNRARAARRCSVRVHDDGTATFSVRAPIHTVLAAHARHDDVARTLRAAGHQAPIAALAADSAIATLVHGTLDVPAGQIDELSEADLDDLIAVVNGHPRVTLQVIVPADVLGLGHPVCATCAAELDPTPAPNPRGGRSTQAEERARGEKDEGEEAGSEPQLPFDAGGVEPPAWARPYSAAEAPSASTDPSDDHDLRHHDDRENSAHRAAEGQPSDPAAEAPPPNADASDDHDPPPTHDDGESSAHPGAGHREASGGYDPSARAGRGQVAEIIGSHPAFVSPGEARELFYFPGTTMYRILTDPADGRCLERTISAYRPDADMRRQVRAADVYSRHPMSRKTGRSLEIDHVVPYSTDPQATTTEQNLANLDLRTHKIKTLQELLVTINKRRDLSFTTLLSQITGSRTHDYRQYLRAIHPEDLDDQADLADQALLAALAHHPEYWAQPGSWLTVDHIDAATGHTVLGAYPDTPHPHDLLGIATEEDSTSDDSQ